MENYTQFPRVIQQETKINEVWLVCQPLVSGCDAVLQQYKKKSVHKYETSQHAYTVKSKLNVLSPAETNS